MIRLKDNQKICLSILKDKNLDKEQLEKLASVLLMKVYDDDFVNIKKFLDLHYNHIKDTPFTLIKSNGIPIVPKTFTFNESFSKKQEKINRYK